MGRMTDKILRVEDLRTETLTGTVVGCQTWSETRIHGGAASQSSYVGPQGGHVSTPAITVSSTTTEELQLFIRRDDGREFELRFVDAGVGFREGNRISIVYVPEIGGEPMALVNHDTGKSRIYENRVSPFLGLEEPYPIMGPIVGRITAVYMLILLPALIYVIYLGLSEEIDGSSFWTYLGLLLGAMPTLFILGAIFGGKVPNGLREGVIETLERRVNEALNADKMRAS